MTPLYFATVFDPQPVAYGAQGNSSPQWTRAVSTPHQNSSPESGVAEGVPCAVCRVPS